MQPGLAWVRNHSRVRQSQNSLMNRRDGVGSAGRRSSRSRSPVNRSNDNNIGGSNQNQASNSSGNRQKKDREQPTNTPSSDEEDLGPFPSSSRSTGSGSFQRVSFFYNYFLKKKMYGIAKIGY